MGQLFLNSKIDRIYLYGDRNILDKTIQVASEKDIIYCSQKDKILDAHFHNYFDRSSYRTQEVVYVLQGKIKCNLYEEDATYIDSAIVESGMIIVQYQGVHEYEMIEDSRVLEVKNGPYHGPDKDRTRVNVRKN